MLSKLIILAFSDDELRSQIGQYQVQINPETYEHKHSTEFSTDHGIDAAGAIAQFKARAPEELSCDITIDATGVVAGVTSVEDEMGNIRKLAYGFKGAIHSPNYLRVVWGKLSFDCMLARMDVSYLLFSPTGVPLRARLGLHFRQHQTPADLARSAGKESADLTHLRVAREGETLPLMCYNIYDGPALYPRVARVNDLNDLMHLPYGDGLGFPPVDV